MHVFLAGASGFVGERVLADLHVEGHSIVAQVHSRKSLDLLKISTPAVEVVRMDLSSPSQTVGLLQAGCEAVIYLPGLLRELGGETFEGIHVEGVRNLIAEAHRVGARRWIQMSALGATLETRSKYYRTKAVAEQLVRASGLDWTILRPSLIFDDRPRRQHNFVVELAAAIRRAPFVPVLGRGNFLLQPVAVEDVSRTIVRSLATPEALHNLFEIGGQKKLSYKQIVRMIARAMGSRKPAVGIPMRVIKAAANLLDRFSWFPISLEEIQMLEQGNYVHRDEDDRTWRETFGITPKRFDESAIRAMLRG